MRRPRLLVLNQYYWPRVEADGRLLTELCEGLAETWHVTVVTGAATGAAAGRTRRHGVEIVRVPSTTFARRRLSLRALNYASYAVLAALRGLLASPPDVVLAYTNPPFVGDLAYAVARRFRAPLVIGVQDVFPETAAVLGRIRSPVALGALGAMVGFYLRRADRIVAIGETMRRRLEEKGVPADRIVVIENWVDPEAIRPRDQANVWAEAHGLAGRFVVMHSGNVGHAQDLDSLVRASVLLRDLEDASFVIVGSGARLVEIHALADSLDAPVRFLPFQRREVLSESLSAAAVHVGGLARGLAGYVVPSRLYGVLSAGRPVIAAAEDESETARLVREVGCGVVVPPGDPEALAAALREAHEGEYDLEAMGRRGRDYVVREASREAALSRYRDLLAEVRTSDS
jgi:colanic acid biosynthesis glycosyl transferase WcaI